jgi:carboxypeptidase Q
MKHALTAAAVLIVTAALSAQQATRPAVGADLATVERIRSEAIQRSQAVEHAWWLSEVYGPRPTGSPGFSQASEWAMKRFIEWGLKNVHQERFAFGQGWTIDRFSVHLVTPQTQSFIGQPRWFSPSTNGPVLSDVVHVRATTDAELAKYKDQLRGKIVIMQAPRAVRMLDGRIILRMGDQEWNEAMTMPEPPATTPRSGPTDAQRAAAAFQQTVQKFLVDEGVAVLLERGSDSDETPGGSDLSWMQRRVDGGTIFPTNGGSRDPNAPKQVPSATLAVEHYNRLARLLEHGQPVTMEVNIKTTFHPETAGGNGINTIAEIPGTDLASEVVMLGAHLDSYPYAAGATDNATGSAAMMEAVRVIQALGLKPRRTIRVALWAGEEQGLLGSRAYVQQHYYDAQTGTVKPEHEQLAAYFNLDNGTGRILGVWGQGNAGAIKLFSEWGQSARELGFKAVSPRSVGSTDHASFENAGLPGFQFIQERLEYQSRTHHSNMDTFDRIQPDELKQQGAVAAIFAWYAANSPEKLPRKPMPAPPGSRQ